MPNHLISLPAKIRSLRAILLFAFAWLSVSFVAALCGICNVSAASTLDVIAHQAARYPEGVTRIKQVFWYAEMASNRIARWQGEQIQTFAMPGGCGPTAVESYGELLIVLCHLNHRFLLVTPTGKVMHSQSRSNSGVALYHPNDAVRDDRGGIYFSSSGDFADAAPALGRIFYLAPSGAVAEVASGIHYANGVEFDRVGHRLLVSAHLDRRVLAYPVLASGQLGARRTLHDLRDQITRSEDWMVGPDGLHLDQEGTLRVALYGGAKVVVFANDTVRSIDTPMQFPTTVYHDPRVGLFVGGVFDLSDRLLGGQVILIRSDAAVMGH